MIEKKDYTVYKILLEDEIKYVGISSRFESRKWQHLHKQGTPWSAIPEDVPVNLIKIEKVEECLSFKLAKRLETKLIREYKLIKNGWNRIRSIRTVAGLRKYNREYNKRPERKEKIKVYAKNWYERHKKLKVG